MAKTISDEVMKLSVVINGNEAQKQFFDLEKSTRSLKNENGDLLIKKKLVEKQLGKESAEYKSLTAIIKANNAEIVSNKAKMELLQKGIGLTGLTMSQLQSKATMLRNTLRNLVPGSEDFKKYEAELKSVSARMSEVSGKAKQTKSSLGSIADGFNRYQGIALSAMAGLTGVVLYVQKIIDISGKLAGAQSNVMKTTGMTRLEVDELTKSFGLLHTRTSRMDLLGIAEQGGRIGVAKEEIGDFVNVMNKASVALGDSFTGGAEEVANKLGKIKFLFQETKDLNVDQAYNSIGSAINDLGANGVASEANIAEFTTRMGSLTDVLKPTIQETLAMGAAFEESGIEAEVSARAYGIFMSQASTESGKFAQVMGISQKAVEDMLNTNPLDFMLKFSEGMKGMDSTDVAKTLDYLGISADGANKVIGAMGNNTARFRELMELSNGSFAEGTSLINEYNIKNNDLEAILERVGHKITGWFASETFVKWLTVAVGWLANFIGATEDADSSASAWKNTLVFTAKILAVITAAMVTNVGWQKIVALWTNENTKATLLSNLALKANAVTTALATMATQLWAIVVAIATKDTIGLKNAINAMTLAMKTTPWGFILSAVTAIGVAYLAFSDDVDVASKVVKNFDDINTEATKNISKQKSEIELLTKIANDEHIAKEKRIKAIDKLNKIIPDYIGHLSLENIKTAEGISILKKYTDELYKNARAKAVQSRFDELAKEKVKIERKTSKDYQGNGVGGFMAKITGQTDDNQFKNRKEIENYVLKNFGGSLNAHKDKTTGATLVNKQMFETLVDKFAKSSGIADKEKELAQKDAEMKALEGELLTKTVKDLDQPSGGKTPNKSKYNVPAGDEKVKTKKGKEVKDPNSSQEQIDALKLENEAKQNDALLKLARQLEDDRINAMQDGYAKELEIETVRYKRELKDLDRQKVHADELVKIDDEIAKAKESGDMSRYAALLEIKKGWEDKNDKLDSQIKEIEKGKLALHNNKLALIEEEGAMAILEKKKQAYETEKLLRETKYNEELAALGNNQVAKDALTQKYQEDELKADETFLKDSLESFKKIIEKGDFNGIDLKLLTPEQITEFKKLADEAGLALSKLTGKKNELSGGETKGSKSLGKMALGLGTNTDIFGFSMESWATLQKNLENGTAGIEEMAVAVKALVNVWSQYDQFATANENAQLDNFVKANDQKKVALKKRFDKGLITENDYNKKVKKLDDEVAEEKFQVELKQAKRKKAISITETIVNTAVSIMQGYAQLGPIGGTIAAVVLGAMGALQINAISNQPLPVKGYEDGLYPETITRQQDGKKFKSKFGGKTKSGLVTDTSHFLVAENGPEMVIDNKAWTQINPDVKEALIRELRGIKGFEDGYYNNELKRYEGPINSSTPPQNPINTNNSSDELLPHLMALIAECTTVMKDLKENGVEGKFYKNDLKSAEVLQDSIKDFNTLRNNAKK